ncbi:DUF4369 domain-containing protein [Lutibacter sp.]
MKRFFLLGIIFIVLISCEKNAKKLKQPVVSSSISSTKFELKGTLENFYPKKVYLNKIIENSIYPIDSSNVTNNNFIFSGFVEYPERFALTFENYSALSIVIIENTKFEVFISSNAINDPVITNSKLNNELSEYKIKAKNIFKKIDFLFPQFQKARLENNVEKLDEIKKNMEEIETEFTNFSYQFIIQNKDSYLAAMLLRDQLKSSTIDTFKIKETYQILSEKVKKSHDSEIIASFLNLH